MTKLILKKKEYTPNNYGTLSGEHVNIKKYKGNMKNTIDIMDIIICGGITMLSNIKNELNNDDINFLIIFKTNKNFTLEYIKIKFNSPEELITFKMKYF